MKNISNDLPDVDGVFRNIPQGSCGGSNLLGQCPLIFIHQVIRIPNKNTYIFTWNISPLPIPSLFPPHSTPKWLFPHLPAAPAAPAAEARWLSRATRSWPTDGCLTWSAACAPSASAPRWGSVGGTMGTVGTEVVRRWFGGVGVEFFMGWFEHPKLARRSGGCIFAPHFKMRSQNMGPPKIHKHHQKIIFQNHPRMTFPGLFHHQNHLEIASTFWPLRHGMPGCASGIRSSLGGPGPFFALFWAKNL